MGNGFFKQILRKRVVVNVLKKKNVNFSYPDGCFNKYFIEIPSKCC